MVTGDIIFMWRGQAVWYAKFSDGDKPTKSMGANRKVPNSNLLGQKCKGVEGQGSPNLSSVGIQLKP